MDMKIIYIIVGMALILIGVALIVYNFPEDEKPKVIPESTWRKHWNEYQNSLSPLEQQWDSLNKVWWGYYNGKNFDMAQETNDKMKLLSDRMHVLLLKYKATQTE